ncbi:MAG: DUF2490 domain-containing protein [Cyclobacteriaceae bacterium]
MKKLLFLLFLGLPFFSHAQDSTLGNWLMYFGNKNLKSGWNWHHEVQYRNYNAIGDLEQLLLRTGVGYNLSENNNNLLLGYGYILSQNYIDDTDDKVDVNEHRIFQQFITRQSFSRFSLQHRYRFEQRFVEDDFRLRFRYFLSINVALSNPEMADNTFYLSAYNEIFLNSEEGNVFDRNRLYGGLGYRVSPKLRFELGYMNQFLANGNRDQLNMVCFFSF